MAKSNPFGINFDPTEASEYAVPNEFLKTPEGQSDVEVVTSVVWRRENIGIHPGDQPSLPHNLAVVGTQLPLF